MAQTTHAGTYRADAAEVAVPPAGLRRISWGAVLAGAAIVLAVQFLLSLLGLGIGLSTVDLRTGDAPQPTSLRIGAGLWWLISNLIALFIGGYLAARLSGMPSRVDGIIHGVLTWSVTLLITIYLLTTTVGSMVGEAFNMVGSALSAAGQGVRQAVPELAETTGLSLKQIEERAEQLLRPEQPGALSEEQARSELISALRQMMTSNEQEAEEARERAVTIIAQQAGINPEQARQRLDQLEAELEQTASQAAQTATEAAETTATAASSASMWTFFALLLGACAAALGGAAGARRGLEYAS
jgi:hypothetical protein